jgi:VWFA-related protein
MGLGELRSAFALAVVVACLVGPGAGRTQGPPGTAQPPQGIEQLPREQKPLRAQAQLVSLFATVRDKHNRLISDLTQNDFRILENGQEQKITFFERQSQLPLTLGLLIDTSGSESRTLGAEQEVASRFMHQVLRKGDLAMVMSFDIDVDLLSDFTEDPDQLERAIRRTVINAPQSPPMVQGPIPQSSPKGTTLYDAIYLACGEKLVGETGRKALVILTDAVDVGSRMRLADGIEAAQRADTVIHVIYIADPAYYAVQGSGESVAKKMAEETGGRVIAANNPKKLEEAFNEVAQELRSQYRLGYVPSNSARDGSFRKIKVETTPAGLRVLTRKGYYAPKD